MSNRHEEEGQALKRLFAGRAQGQFAQQFKVPGGPSMISQHFSGHRPIQLEAAIAYARGLGCSIADFSPRLAQLVHEAALLAGPLVAREPAPAASPSPAALELAAHLDSTATAPEQHRIAFAMAVQAINDSAAVLATTRGLPPSAHPSGGPTPKPRPGRRKPA